MHVNYVVTFEIYFVFHIHFYILYFYINPFLSFFGPKAGGRDLVSLLLLHKKKLLRIRKLQERTTPRRKMQSICKQLLKNKYPRPTKCQAHLGEVLSIQKIIKIKNFREDPTLFKSRKETYLAVEEEEIMNLSVSTLKPSKLKLMKANSKK